jgi:sulfatase maturation enzyme AslB (radical SAM superfamily)
VNTYCPYPFKHVFADPKGTKPCCSYTNVFPGSIQEWITSNELKQLQDDVLNNRYNDGCIACLHGDALDKVSSRHTALTDYRNTIYDKTEIDFVDVRSSNICNFKCRSCEPSYSSRIQAEVRRNPPLEKFYSIGKMLPQDDNYEWILDNLSQLKRIMFTGGEPTQIPHIRDILLEIQRRQLDIKIQIISNASFTDDFWVDITKEMPNINWALSIDACGHEAEIIRDGTNWEVVASNVERLFGVAHSVNIGTVVTNLNVLHLAELFWFVNHMKRYKARANNGASHMISICNFPKHFSPYNWPDVSRPYVIEHLEQAKVDAKQDSQKQILEILIKNISETIVFDFMQWSRFISHNQALDNLRNQNFIKDLITVPII